MSPPPRNRIIHGDALTRLRELSEASVDCIVTSPPYFRLRDYGTDGQIGLEPHVDAWVEQLRAVLTQCQRVLVPTGTLWLNLGDSFSAHPREGAARKSLLLAPERLALALSRDGWIIRNKIVWAKPSTTPTSVTDRLATTHEVIYLLARSARYYFDLDSLRQPLRHPLTQRTTAAPAPSRPPRRKDTRPAWLGPNSDGDSGLPAMRAAGRSGHPLGKNPGDVWTIGVSRYRGAHFATYPEQLAYRMVLAGSPRERCSHCRRPWTRRLLRDSVSARRLPARPSCACQAPAEPGLVLDPFIGSGTTAISAAKLGRDWLGIELNLGYIALAEQRIADALTRPSDNNHDNNSNQPREEVT